jgi:hypothetical protein
MLGTNAQYTGFKNRIINGAMVISQRFGTSNNNNAGNSYTLDRFVSNSSPFNCAQNLNGVTPPGGFTKYLGFQTSVPTAISAGSYNGVAQAIEGYNIADFNWGSSNAVAATLSFWVYSSVTGTWGGVAYNDSFDYSYVFTYSIPVANTWTYITLTIPAPTTGTFNSTTSTGVKIYWSMGTGSTYSGTATGAWQAGGYLGATGAVAIANTNNATFYITGVQLEKGSIATSFDYRPYGTEFNLCQRYYSALPDTGAQNGLGAGVCLNSSLFYFVAVYPVPMRTAPSFTSTGTFQVIVTTGYTPSSVTLNAAGTTSAALVAAISGVTGGNGGFIRGGGSACSLNFSAEL